MGINYYFKTVECEKCKRYDILHIGKIEKFYRFAFWGTEELNSWKAWQLLIDEGGVIYDETNLEVPVEHFKTIVEASKEMEIPDLIPHLREYFWKDEEGFQFTSQEFD